MSINKSTSAVLLIFILVCLFFGSCVKELKPLPIADFSYTASANCVLPMTISFQNLSQNANVYRWDFGDGTPISFNENPIHIYQHEGVYTAILTAYGNGGTHEVQKLIYAVTTPVSSFYTHDTIVTDHDTVHFFSTTNSTLPSTLLWSFGDGFTSTLKNPTHVYTYPGTYSVVLTATNACGASYVVHNNYVVVSQVGVKPTADFTASQTLINTGNSINFTDLSLNSPTSWKWTFVGGSPSTSNVKNPTGIVYNAAGTFDVKLKVTNQSGSDSLTKQAYINVAATGSAPVADFTADVTTISVGGSVNFTDLSLNNPTSWNWQFQGGNPNTSTMQNPIITYNTAGSYNVALTATNGMGNNTKTKQMYINVNPSVITQVLIKKITVQNMPFPGMPPTTVNPYYQITSPTNVVLLDGRAVHMSNITQMLLPIYWDLTPAYLISNLNNVHKIRLWDWRPIQANDVFINEVSFNMSNYINPPNAYPSSIVLQQNQTKIVLDLQWQ
jgi:PKD repeat protein